MINRKLVPVGLVFITACAVTSPVSTLTQGSSRTIGEQFVVTGRYYYEDGDRLSWRCELARLCVETLVRDERLQREVVSLLGATLTLRVERVDACGSRSSQVACFQSLDRSALRIEEWIEVEVSHPQS
jgi:hypothetical protein